MAEREWSSQQRAIFDWFAAATGNLIVRARAGTGKTTTILEAVRHVPGEAKILVAAFNARIAAELKAKVRDHRAEARTLHSLGLAQLGRHWKVKPDPDLEWERIDTAEPGMPSEMGGLVKRLVGFAKNAALLPDVGRLVDLAYDRDCDPDADWQDDGWTTQRIAGVAAKVLVASLERRTDGRISFDDMLYVPVVSRFVRPWYSWVVIDEAQDMNTVQLLLAQQACRPNGHLVVVGDDRQAIYGFRGADSGALDRLKMVLRADELGLTTTYRCPRIVVEYARRIVPDFEAAPSAPEGTLDACAHGELPDQVAAGDAILSRTNAPLVGICLGLIRKGVPSRIEGRDIGKALAAVVRKLATQNSVPGFLQRLGVWEAREQDRARAKAKSKYQAEQRCSDIHDRAETLRELADGAVSIAEIVQRCERMFVDTKEGAPPRQMVVCSSVHKAKGLEWERVFVLDWTFFRGGRAGPEEANIEYVAVTRAKRALVLVHQGATLAVPAMKEAEAPVPGENCRLAECTACGMRGLVAFRADEPTECPTCGHSSWLEVSPTPLVAVVAELAVSVTDPEEQAERYAAKEARDAEVAAPEAGAGPPGEPAPGDDDGQLHGADRGDGPSQRDARDREPADGLGPAGGDAGGDLPGVSVVVASDGRGQ